MAYTLTTSILLGPSNTGLSLYASLVDSTNAVLASGISSGFVEIGNGDYMWTYSQYNPDFRGLVKFYNSSTHEYMANCVINPEEMVINRGVDLDDYTITINTLDENLVPIGGAKVFVYPSGSSTLIDSVETNDSNGRGYFSVNTGTYAIHARKPYYANWLNPTYVEVTDNCEVNLIGTKLSLPEPPESETIRLYAYVADLGLSPRKEVELIVEPSGIGPFIDRVYLRKPISAVSDANGLVYIDVAASGLPVRVRIPKAEFDIYLGQPVSGVVNLKDLL